jgi:hypothetical protein
MPACYEKLPPQSGDLPLASAVFVRLREVENRRDYQLLTRERTAGDLSWDTAQFPGTVAAPFLLLLP